MLRMAFQRRERTVCHEETAPKGRFEPEGMTKDSPKRPTVGRNQDGFPFPYRRIENTAGPLLQRKEILPAGRFPDPASPEPCLPVFRKTFTDLPIGQASPEAVIAFPEFRRRQNRDGLRLTGSDDPGGFERSAQVAGIDPFQGHGCQARRQGLRLFSSPLMEGNVGLALDPLIPIPRRFTMANKINN